MVLDKISEMKRKGIPTNQIIKNLREQGISPREINEALSQSEIKSEISGQNIFPNTPQANFNSRQWTPQIGNRTEQTYEPDTEMRPSISQGEDYQQEEYTAPYQEERQTPDLQVSPYSQIPYQENAQEYQQENYPEYEPYQPVDMETISDISSQIVEEKTKQLKKDISSFESFKKEAHEKIRQLDHRLTKIENVLEELQMAVIKKVGSYGDDIKNLSHEMKATQESFSKILNPLTDNIREMQKITGHNTSKSPNPKLNSKEKSKKSSTFEDYLR